MSAITKPIIQAASLTTTNDTYYTVPAGERIRLEKITVTNTDTVIRNVTIYILPFMGGSVTNMHAVVLSQNIPVNTTTDFTTARHVIKAGDIIKAKASQGGVLSLYVSGTSFSNA